MILTRSQVNGFLTPVAPQLRGLSDLDFGALGTGLLTLAQTGLSAYQTVTQQQQAAQAAAQQAALMQQQIQASLNAQAAAQQHAVQQATAAAAGGGGLGGQGPLVAVALVALAVVFGLGRRR